MAEPGATPVSWETVVELGLDVSTFHTCSAFRKGVNAGCPYRIECHLDVEKKKGQEALEAYLANRTVDTDGAGPCNKGVRILKRDIKGNVLPASPSILSCYHIAQTRRRLELNRGTVKVVCGEGDTITVRGSTTHDEVIPGQGTVRMIDDKLIATVVPKFKDEHSNDLLARAAARADMEIESAEQSKRDLEELEGEAAAAVSKPRGPRSRS